MGCKVIWKCSSCQEEYDVPNPEAIHYCPRCGAASTLCAELFEEGKRQRSTDTKTTKTVATTRPRSRQVKQAKESTTTPAGKTTGEQAEQNPQEEEIGWGKAILEGIMRLIVGIIALILLGFVAIGIGGFLHDKMGFPSGTLRLLGFGIACPLALAILNWMFGYGFKAKW